MVRPDAPIEITVTVRNHGRRWVTIGTSTCPQPFVVRVPTGEIVGPEPVYRALAASYARSLGPGEAHVFTARWAGGGRGPGLTTARLPAGTYRIGAWLAAAQPAIDGNEVAVTIAP